MIKRLIVLSILCVSVFVGGCSKNTATNSKTLDVVSNDTKPPPPDSNVTGENPRDKKNKRERPDQNPSATPEPAPFRPAAENSEASVMMNADGSITEIRIFNEHPQIQKVEATWTDPANKDLKVYLTSGKILTAKTDKIPTLSSATTDAIMQAVRSNSAATKGDRPRVVNGK